MKKHHFFAFISRMKYINRWGLMRNTFHENIQEHSLQVAIVAHALATIKNKVFNGNVNAERAAVLAMYHDCNETITGDMPTPIKYYNPEINEAYKKVEHLSQNKLISMLPNDLQDTYKEILFAQEGDKELWTLVKAADRISAYIKCLEEENAGNREFKKAGETILKTIKELNMPEAKYFLEKFIPSFSLSLDELD